jgi:hypothetical protein
MAAGFQTPWAMAPNVGAPACKAGEPGFMATTWICGLVCNQGRAYTLFKLWPANPSKVYVAEVTLSLWGVTNLVMTTWQYVAGPIDATTTLDYARNVSVTLPGQALRFMSLPALNQDAYFIPVGILAALTLIGYLGSAGVAIAQVEIEDAVLEPALA